MYITIALYASVYCTFLPIHESPGATVTITLAVSAATIAEIDDVLTALVPESPSVDHLSILANRLRIAMDRCPTGCMTVATLTATSGVSDTTIYDILNGTRTSVNVATASLIEASLGIRVFKHSDVTIDGGQPGPRTEPRSQTIHDHSGRQVVCPSCHLQVRREANCMDCGAALTTV
jgi:hypothetical protein